MPKKKTGTKVKRATTTPQAAGKRHFGIGMIAIAVGLLLGGFFLYWVLTGMGGGARMQAKMAEYLEEKYGKEFVVQESTYKGGSIGGDVKGFHHALATPADNTSDAFEIRRYDNRRFEDDYVSALWSKQATDTTELQDFAATLEPGAAVRVQVNNVISYASSSGDSLLDTADVDPRNIPSFAEVIAEYPDDVTYSLYIKRSIEKTDEVPPRYVDELVQAVNYLRESQLKHPGIRYVTNMSDSRFICDLYGERFDSFSEPTAASCFKLYKGTE